MRGPPPRHPDDDREPFAPVEGVIDSADELRQGDRVVYPNQGVCAVVGREEKDIAGQKLVLIRMEREEDGASVFVPTNKVTSIGLRRVATSEQIEGVFSYLAAVFDDPELDWKIRHRDNADRLIAGGVLGVAEVVKGLHSLSRIRPLPTKEREQYDNARHLLVNEVAVSLDVPPGVAEDYVDYALMPPAGTKFNLKPPPTPVMLPPRPKRRRPVEEEEGEEIGNLGLSELGIDLGATDLDGAIAVPEPVAGVGSEAPGEEASEGAAVEEGASESPDEEDEEPPAEPTGKEKSPRAKKPAPPAAKKPTAKKHAAKQKATPRQKPAPAKAKKPPKPSKPKSPQRGKK